MKWYQCHKRVQAAKITEIYGRVELDNPGATVTNLGFKDGTRAAVTEEWLRKHQPEIGGYLVQYEDGYQSFSPAAAFEAGYSAMPEVR